MSLISSPALICCILMPIMLVCAVEIEVSPTGSHSTNDPHDLRLRRLNIK